MKDVIIAFSRALPHVTSKRIARLTGHTQRVVQRWISGELDVPPAAFQVAADQVQKLEQGKWSSIMEEAVRRGHEQGLHPEVMASHLAVEYRKLTGVDIE